MSTTIKVPDGLRRRIAERARERHVSQADVIAQAMEALERREFWSAVEAGYAWLRQDESAWADYVEERDEWVDAGLVDESR